MKHCVKTMNRYTVTFLNEELDKFNTAILTYVRNYKVNPKHLHWVRLYNGNSSTRCTDEFNMYEEDFLVLRLKVIFESVVIK